MNGSYEYRPSAAAKVSVVLTEIFWFLGWLATAAVVVLIILVTFTGFHPKQIRLPVEIVYDAPGGSSPIGQRIYEGDPRIIGFVTAIVDSSEVGLLNFMLIMPLMLLVIYLWVVWILRRFLRSIRTGTPFIRENVRRLKSISWIVIFTGPLYGVFNYIYGSAYAGRLDIPGATVRINSDANLLMIVIGVVLLVISHVFDHGVSLTEDRELTI